jgi:hypothetical protein
MNELDMNAREVVRQARPALTGNRMSGATMAGAASSVAPAATSTIVDSDGGVRRLFILDYDTLNDPATYLGNAAIEG